MKLTRESALVLCAAMVAICVPMTQIAQAAKQKTKKTVVKKIAVKKKTTAKKAVVKSGVRYDDGIVIISDGGSIDVSNGARSVGTRDVTIAKSQKFTPPMLPAIRAQAQRNSGTSGTAAATSGTRTASTLPPERIVTAPTSAPRANRVRPPAFNVADTRNRMVTLDQYRGSVLVLDFWATWCPPCREDAPEMVQLYNKYRPQGMDILGISLDTDAQKLAAFTRANGMQWRQIFGGKAWDSDLSRLYQIRSVPYLMVIARDGTVFAAGVRGRQLEQAVVAALAER